MRSKTSLLNLRLWFACGTILTFTLLALLSPFLISQNALQLDLSHDLASPLQVGGLGRTENGVSLAVYLLLGMRVSFIVSVSVTCFCLIVGVIYGMLAAYNPGRIDTAMMRLIDILLAFPGLLLAMYLASILQPSINRVVIALSAMGWVSLARIIRASTLSLLKREFITAAMALGVRPWRILWQHILPHLTNIILIESAFLLSSSLLGEAALSFLGLGVPPGTPSLGSLLDQGVAYLFIAPHIVIFAGCSISLIILAFHLLADELQARSATSIKRDCQPSE